MWNKSNNTKEKKLNESGTHVDYLYYVLVIRNLLFFVFIALFATFLSYFIIFLTTITNNKRVRKIQKKNNFICIL